ncbi:S-adenosyl-L-methionine-dependent methyltransferase [Aspergillus karnatakaensis]|uniref:O-methyltransferase n=1 Tax=Aspergillus karnatakaensis TaxID=1810916 RepID=UPI003CCCD9B6
MSTDQNQNQDQDPRRPGRSLEKGRELKLLNFIKTHPTLPSITGNPDAIIDLIEEFSQKYHFMTVGLPKGNIVTSIIAEQKPSTMIELGCYVGYSAILFGDAVRKAGGARYYSLELNSEFAEIAREIVQLAGLADFVTILVGRSDVLLNNLFESGEVESVEMLFIDHYKPAYTLDLKLCEQLGKIIPGRSVIVADNVIFPGNPPYLEYVRSSVQEKRGEAEKGPVRAYELEGFDGRTVQSFMGAENAPRFEIVGDPNLVYESVLRQPEGDRDAVEVTRCVGVEG